MHKFFVHIESFALASAAFLSLLAIASFTIRLSSRLGVPHSVFLVLLGMLLATASKAFPALSFIDSFELSPELLFYVLLPTLIFEAAFKLPLHRLKADIVPIMLLAIGSYLLSVAIITVGLHFVLGWLGVGVPLLFTLLFATIISATDPVAVLAIFKQLGVRPRLARLFEAESLFNDGTGLAAFVIVVGIIANHGIFTAATVPVATAQFVVMIGGGVAFGVLMGALFSKLIEWVRHEEIAEMTLTLIMAHTTFLLADSSRLWLHFGGIEFEFSAIVATAVAAIILGNTGVQKFSPAVRQQMYAFWEHFAFAANALIFLLIGMLVIKSFRFDALEFAALPIAAAIIVTVIARLISVRATMLPYNLFAPKHARIPRAWQMILSWGSLRGAVAIAALLLLPTDTQLAGWTLPLTPHEFVSLLVLSCIVFTMFVKAGSIKHFVKKMRLGEFSSTEKVAQLEAKIMLDISLLERIKSLQDKGYISQSNAKKLKKMYKGDEKRIAKQLRNLFCKRLAPAEAIAILQLHALTIETKVLQTLFDYGEVTEEIFWHLQCKLQRQQMRIENGGEQTQNPLQMPTSIPLDQVSRRFRIARARSILSSKVVKHLQSIAAVGVAVPPQIMETVLGQYQTWNAENRALEAFLSTRYAGIVKHAELEIFTYFLKAIEQKIIDEMHSKSMIDERVFAHLSAQK